MPPRRAANRTTPRINDRWLALGEGQPPLAALDSPAWFAWLRAPGSTTFYFDHADGAFTARREQRRDGWFWYAYARRDGQTRKLYLGRSEDVSHERLARIARRLGLAHRPPRPEPEAAPPLLAAKLAPPAPARLLLERRRLLERWAGLPANAIVLLAAPAGWGKTTLAGQWAASRGDEPGIAWLSLDEGDDQPPRFWRCLLAAVESASPGAAAEALGMLAAGAAPRPALAALLNRLAALPRPPALVLDNLHAISDEQIFADLAWLIEHLPGPLALATREEPPLPLSGWRAAGRLAAPELDALRFDADEQAEILRRLLGGDAPPAALAALAAHTEGWPAAVQLAALALADLAPAEQARRLAQWAAGAAPDPGRFAAGLAAAVFDQQPAALRELLAATSILGRFNAQLSAALLDRQADAALLEAARRRGLALALDGPGGWFRTHGLLRQHALEQARRQLGQDGLARLHRRASAWFAGQDELAPAIDHALLAGDHGRAAALLAPNGYGFLTHEGLPPLRRWLDALAPEAAARPDLALWQVWRLLLDHQLDAAAALIDELEPQLGAAPEAELRGHLGLLRASLARRRGDLGAARELSHAALAGLPETAHLLRSIAARNLCAGYLNSGDTFAAEAALGRAWLEQELLEARIPRQADRQARARDARAIRLALQLEKTSLRLMQGWLHEAAAGYRELLASAGAAHDHARAAIACVGLGQILREWNDLPAARELFEQALDRCSKVEAPVTRRNALIGLALTEQALGRPADAWATMEAAVELARGLALRGALVWATAWQTRLALLQGRSDAARRWALAYRSHRHAFPEVNLYDIEDLTLARALLAPGAAPGELDEAAALLARMLPRAEAAGRAPIVIEILLLQALIGEARQPGAGWGAPAQAPLRRALDLAGPEGYARLFADCGPPMLALLRTARRRGSAPQAAIQRILAAAEPRRDDPDPDEADPLSPREREVLQLLADGCSNQQIAELLVVSLNTVKSHLKSIYAKLGAGSRTRALAVAHGLKLIPG